MARIEKQVTLTKESAYEHKNFSGFGYETVHIYKMTDSEGAVYIWKTTAFLKLETINGDEVETFFPHEGDVFVIKATVKGETEYKGEPQTEINRVKIASVVSVFVEEEKARQLQTIEEGDFIWKDMPYAQYKSHYSDCEAVSGSFRRHEKPDGTPICPPTIDVIIRKGRLKPSGTRGLHYAYYEVVNEKGERQEYYAISEETAIKRAHRELGGEWWVEDVRHRNCTGQYW